ERAEEVPDRTWGKARPVVAVLMDAPAHWQPCVAARVVDALCRRARRRGAGAAAVAPEPAVTARFAGREGNRHVVLAVGEPYCDLARAARAAEGAPAGDRRDASQHVAPLAAERVGEEAARAVPGREHACLVHAQRLLEQYQHGIEERHVAG